MELIRTIAGKSDKRMRHVKDGDFNKHSRSPYRHHLFTCEEAGKKRKREEVAEKKRKSEEAAEKKRAMDEEAKQEKERSEKEKEAEKRDHILPAATASNTSPTRSPPEVASESRPRLASTRSSFFGIVGLISPTLPQLSSVRRKLGNQSRVSTSKETEQFPLNINHDKQCSSK